MANTIDDLLASLQPSDEDRRRQQAAAMLGMFGSLIGSRRGQVMPALQQGMFRGFDMYNQAGEAAQKSKLDALRTRSAAAEALRAEQALQDEQAMRGAREASTIPGLPPMGPPTPDGRTSEAVPPAFDLEGYQKRVMGINPDAAIKLEPLVRRMGVRQIVDEQGRTGGAAGMPGQAGAPAAPQGQQESGVLMESPGLSIRRRQAQSLSATAEALRRRGYGEEAAAYDAKAAALEPKFREGKPYTLNGKRVIIRETDDGEFRVMDYQADSDKLTFSDEGGYIVTRDPRTGQQVGTPIPKTLSPGDIARIVESRNQFFAARAAPTIVNGQLVYPPLPSMPGIPGVGTTPGVGAASAPSAAPPQQAAPAPNPSPDIPAGAPTQPAPQGAPMPGPGGRPVGAMGGVVPVPGGESLNLPQSVKGDIFAIDEQLATIGAALELVRNNKTAFGFARGAATMSGSLGETIAGRFDKPAERQARAFVYNIVSQAIKERAGTAQSKQEQDRLRGFLPSEMDNAEQISDKFMGYQHYLRERRRGLMEGGPTSKPTGGGASSGMSIRDQARALVR